MISGSITAKPQVFAAAVKWTAKFLVGKPVVPVQAGLLLDARDGGLFITVFSENVTARAYLPVGGDGSGRVLVSGKLLDALVSTFPDKPVELRQDEADTLTISAGRWTGTLPAMADGDFPAVPAELPTMGTAAGEALASAIHRAGAGRAIDPKQPIATHLMHLTFGETSLTAMATNNYRAARDRVTFGWDPDYELDTPTGPVVPYGISALVMAQNMVAVAEAFAGPDDVRIGLDTGSISLTSPTRSVVLRQVADPFPMLDAMRQFFTVEHPERAVVKVGDLAEPLKRAALVREKEGPVGVAFTGDLISIQAKADQLKQNGAEEVDATYSGPDYSLLFNPKFFGDAISSAPGDTVEIAFTTERLHGVILSVPGNDDWRHVLMPIKK